MNQKTIKNNISFEGIGIHTGVSTKITLKPAKANTGIRFIRTDIKNNPVIYADVDNVSLTKRSTSLKKGDAEIKTVEHLLAAISGANIDNQEQTPTAAAEGGVQPQPEAAAEKEKREREAAEAAAAAAAASAAQVAAKADAEEERKEIVIIFSIDELVSIAS